MSDANTPDLKARRAAIQAGLLAQTNTRTGAPVVKPSAPVPEPEKPAPAASKAAPEKKE